MNVKTATTETRTAVRRALPGVTGVTINSKRGYELATNTTTVVTTVTYPLGTDFGPLTEALSAVAYRVQAGDTAATITWRA